MWFHTSLGYAEAGRYIYEIAQEMYDAGDYFPIWGESSRNTESPSHCLHQLCYCKPVPGTCLGYELLTYLAANNTDIRTDCKSQKVSLPLEFKEDFQESRLFENCPADVIEILKTKPVTPNFHNFCITEKNMTAFGLDQDWRVMSLNDDQSANSVRFISTLEHRTYPFYGVQFHPEKVLYEWVENYNISHMAEATAASQYFARFFVDECRRNSHTFGDYKEENRHLIYNFPVTFSALKGSTYQQAYMFQEDVDYPSDVATGLGGCLALTLLAAFIANFVHANRC